MTKIFITYALLAILLFPLQASAATGLNLCVKGTKIQAKAKCTGGEHALSLSKLASTDGGTCIVRTADADGTAVLLVVPIP